MCSPPGGRACARREGACARGSAEIRTGLEDFSGTAFSADLGGSSKYSNGENTSQRGSSLKTEEKKGSM